MNLDASPPRSVARLCLPLWWLLLGPALWAQAPEANAVCASCHDVGQKLEKKAHQSVACSTCHEKHGDYPHPANIPKPECKTCHQDESARLAASVHGEAARAGKAAPDCTVCHAATAHAVEKSGTQAFRLATLETCGMCHDQIAAEFKTSVHGKAVESGSTEAPICSDCHGDHSIQRPTNPLSTVYASNVSQTCGQCHADVRLARRFNLPDDRVTSFEASYHGLAIRSGSLTAANCASCHGVHHILPSTDLKSTINPRNLAATCGKCHPGAGLRFALGPMHSWGNRAEAPAVVWTRRCYMIVIPLVLGLMLVHNLGDWFRKLWRLRVRPVIEPTYISKEIRMLPAERWQHALLLISFAVLTWTGFALIYPAQWWARPLLTWEARWPVRGILHRFASVIFMFVAAGHLVSLLRVRRLREHWKELAPNLADVREAAMGFAFNAGIGSARPQRSSHSYIEKAEYWAVVWGAVIMILTGILLWANTFVLQWLPKVVVDVATAVHFYEAVLASLAIVIWHIYFVVLDPDVYPMDTAWLTGTSIRRKPANPPRNVVPEPVVVKTVEIANGRTAERDRLAKLHRSNGGKIPPER